jgi:hypothetical protein
VWLRRSRGPRDVGAKNTENDIPSDTVFHQEKLLACPGAFNASEPFCAIHNAAAFKDHAKHCHPHSPPVLYEDRHRQNGCPPLRTIIPELVWSVEITSVCPLLTVVTAITPSGDLAPWQVGPLDRIYHVLGESPAAFER